jgi:hypothetical protein
VKSVAQDIRERTLMRLLDGAIADARARRRRWCSVQLTPEDAAYADTIASQMPGHRVRVIPRRDGLMVVEFEW